MRCLMHVMRGGRSDGGEWTEIKERRHIKRRSTTLVAPYQYPVSVQRYGRIVVVKRTTHLYRSVLSFLVRKSS